MKLIQIITDRQRDQVIRMDDVLRRSSARVQRRLVGMEGEVWTGLDALDGKIMREVQLATLDLLGPPDSG